MKHLIFGCAFFLFLSKSYAQEVKSDSIQMPTTFITSLTVEQTEVITDRRLIGVREIAYIVQNGVVVHEGYSVDSVKGELYISTPPNSKTTIIFK